MISCSGWDGWPGTTPHWTPARAGRAPRRPPAGLAPDADAVRAVAAAVHQAADALAGLAIIDLKAVAAAGRARRLYVPARLAPERHDVPRRFVTAPAARFRAPRDAYQQARDTSITARLPLDEITLAARAPSMPPARARAAASDQASPGTRPDGNDFLNPPPDYSPFRRSRASAGSAGPLEQAVRNRQVSGPALLLRAVAIGNTAERLIRQADNVTSAAGSPERRENWQRAVRRAAVLADESFPHGPVTSPSSEAQPALPVTPPTLSCTSSPGRHGC